LSKSSVILCVDNEATALSVRSQVLSRAGYVVLTASDGAAALELFKCIRTDLIIMDHGLAGLPGTQVAAEMKRLKPAVPIVLWSDLMEAAPGSEHADLRVTKGMPAAEFLRAVGKLIPE
jgi:CheY-like chemotaxis protein